MSDSNGKGGDWLASRMTEDGKTEDEETRGGMLWAAVGFLVVVIAAAVWVAGMVR